MSWKGRLRGGGSFRGAPFHVEDHEAAGGRRIVVHQYPQRDTPYPEDLGRKAERFEVVAFLVGRDYMAARDALVNACRAPGPGRLVHPWLGTFDASCDEWRVIETTAKGGMARVRMMFVEGGRNEYPTSRAHDEAVVGEAAAAARAAVQSSLEARWLP